RTEERVERLERIVEELAEAQKRTEERVERLERIVEELAEAQKRTEERVERLERIVEELAEAQKRTEERLGRLEATVQRLAEAQEKTELEIAKLALGLRDLRRDLGGLSLTMSYAFENEAFRALPRFLKEKYGIEVIEKFIRQEILGKEINILAKAKKNGTTVYVVGESKLRLDERRDQSVDEVLEELEEKVQAVKKEFGDVEVIRLLVTHYATKGFLREASKKGVIVVQSFEW
ncbi:MAG: hypothetical protein NZ583_03885, partial [Desulfobacterota bacterium]|nr:hypothetical protein [Thermodesulfobacteriota bacterium]